MMSSVYRRISIDGFLEAYLDQPDRFQNPKASVVICSTQRSGSYLLCRLLTNAGIGIPTEYFHDRMQAALTDRWCQEAIPINDPLSYVDALIRRRTTANGLWAAKVQWWQLMTEERTPYRDALLDRLGENVKFIYLTRMDKVAQAVSLYVAQTTGVWDSQGIETTQPGPQWSGNIAGVLRCIKWIENNEASWRKWFSSQGITPMEITYENLVANQPEYIEKIADLMRLSESEWTRQPPESGLARLEKGGVDSRKRLISETKSYLSYLTHGRFF